MKALDLETNKNYDVVSINYDDNSIILESENGRISKTIDKVRLSINHEEDMKGKTIFHPKAFWMIPFVGWFMLPFTLFSNEDCVVVSDSIKHQLIMIIAGIGPILLILSYLLIQLNFYS